VIARLDVFVALRALHELSAGHRDTPEGGDGVGRGTVSCAGVGGSGREDSDELPSHWWRMYWSAGDRIESEELHTPTSWESGEDLALKRNKMFINKMIEVALMRPEVSGQFD
jgi:hypothetical protein